MVLGLRMLLIWDMSMTSEYYALGFRAVGFFLLTLFKDFGWPL